MVANFVLPIVMKIGEYLVAPVGRQFGYLFFYESNIKNLEKQVQKLEDERFGVQKSVDEAETKGETIAPGVERWLKTVNELSEEAKKFLEDEVKANKGCLNGWCPNLKSRYSLSRKATKKIQGVEELGGEGNFARVSYPTLPPPMGTTFAFTNGFKVFESRRSIMNDVMEALTNDSTYMIGICGMGGVGKTTMVKEVAKKAEENKMFNKIVMVVVSQNPDLINIQDEIAKTLGFELFGGTNLFARAGDLGSRILSIGRVLVILDDVRKRLDLNDIGIPFENHHKGCKIVLTSRSENVCNSMDTQKNFKVGILGEEEAWNLFKEMAGISNEGTSHPTDLQSTQRAVAKECGGLPIAIVTVGRALRCKSKNSWDSALVQLRKSMVKNITEVDEKVIWMNPVVASTDSDTTTTTDWYAGNVADSGSYINAAFRSSRRNEAYLFMKNEYVLLDYAPGSKADKVLYGPLLICDGFPSLAGTAFAEHGIDSAFGSHYGENEAFIFSGNLCAQINYAPHSSDDKIIKGPMTITEMFPFFKGTVFESGVDASFESSRRYEAYLFKGNRYARINYGSDSRLITDRFITGGFPSLKNTIFESGIGAAFASHRTNVAYLFKGHSYARINFAPGTTDDYLMGGVKDILPNWPSLRTILTRKNRGLDVHDHTKLPDADRDHDEL